MTKTSLFRRILNWFSPATLSSHDRAALIAHRDAWLGLGVQYQMHRTAQRPYSY